MELMLQDQQIKSQNFSNWTSPKSQNLLIQSTILTTKQQHD